jgi:hypothetical protein
MAQLARQADCSAEALSTRLSGRPARKSRLGAGPVAQTKTLLGLDLYTKSGTPAFVALRQRINYKRQTKYLKNKEFPEANFLRAERKFLFASRVGDVFGWFSTELSTAFVNLFKPLGGPAL